MTPNTPTLSTPATPGSTAQRGAEAPGSAPLTFANCGGTVLFAGMPLDITTAREGRRLLRRAAAEATERFNFTLGTALWEAHQQLSDAYDQALRWRLAGASR